MSGTDEGPMDSKARTDCDRARDLLPAYLEDQLEAAEGRAVRLHLAGCRACHRAATARDPLQILAPLSADGLPARLREGFWAEIQSQLPARSGPGKPGVMSRLALPWADHPARTALLAGAAAAVLLAALVAPRLLARRAAEPPSTVARAHSGASIPYHEMAMEAKGPAPQTVEQVRTPGSRHVQVYSMKYYLASASPGGSDRQAPPVTELVLIVDEGLDL